VATEVVEFPITGKVVEVNAQVGYFYVARCVAEGFCCLYKLAFD